MTVRAGTSGFSYKEWKGPFYPADLKNAGMLAYYASKLGTVEINNTFYRMPKREVLAKWAEQVPEGFVFVLKAPQRITHRERLKDSGDSLAYFLSAAEVLGAKLGPILFQLPPFFKKDVARLRDFLALLPAGPRAAFEPRHDSWQDDEVYQVLRDAGVALCLADTDAGEPPLVHTADWGYLRLRRQAYGDDDLARWAGRVRDAGWSDAFVFFKHEDAGTGPRLALRFLELGGF